MVISFRSCLARGTNCSFFFLSIEITTPQSLPRQHCPPCRGCRLRAGAETCPQNGAAAEKACLLFPPPAAQTRFPLAQGSQSNSSVASATASPDRRALPARRNAPPHRGAFYRSRSKRSFSTRYSLLSIRPFFSHSSSWAMRWALSRTK